MIRGLAALFGLVVRECSVVLRLDVTQVAQNVHYLVIAEQGHYFSADPTIVVIQQACAPENEAEIIEITMDVAHRDESLCRLAGRCHGVRRRKADAEQKQDQSGAGSAQQNPSLSDYHFVGFGRRQQIYFDWKR